MALIPQPNTSLRPVQHQTDARIKAHTFVALIVYCLQVTLKHLLLTLASRLTTWAALEKMAALQMKVKTP
jgi:hypothetical protein